MPRTLCASLFGMLAALVICGSASAEEHEAPPEPNWILSLEAGLEGFDFESDGSIDGVLDGTIDNRQLIFELGGEIAGPALKSTPGRPRLFLGGGIGLPIDANISALDVGDPENDVNPEQDIEGYLRQLDAAVSSAIRPCRETPRPCPEPLLEEFKGQGADIRIDLDTPTWYGNLGASFDFPVFADALVQVRPSLAYRGEKVDMAGRLTRANLDEFDLNIPPGGCDRTDPCTVPPTADFSIFRSRTGSKSRIYHHLGPRLELGVALSRSARPIRTTLYLQGTVLWLVSDRSKTLVGSDGIGSYSVRRDEISFRGGAGIRFSWLGGLGID